MKNPRSAAIGFIFATILLDVIGIGLIIPVIPTLIEELLHSNISEAARFGGYLTATYSIMQFLFAPILGRLSDKYGRRPVLLFSLFGFALDYLLLYFAPNIIWLFVARALSGITGASITTATAYIADISTNENRTKNFGMIGGAFGLGFIIGPMIGGLLGDIATRLPFMVAAILTFINWLYGYFILPESLGKEHRRPFSWASAIPGKSLLSLKKYPEIVGLLIAYFLIYIGAHAVQSNWSFFTIEKFNWSKLMIGLSLGMAGLMVALVQAVLIKKINPWLGNERSIYIGFIFYAAGLFMFAFATQGWMMFAILIPYCFGGIAGPALQSIISGNVSRTEQGELQGALTSLISLTSIIGPPLMTGLFAYFTGPKAPFRFEGVSFFVGAIIMMVAAIIAWVNLRSPKAHIQAEN